MRWISRWICHNLRTLLIIDSWKLGGNQRTLGEAIVTYYRFFIHWMLKLHFIISHCDLNKTNNDLDMMWSYMAYVSVSHNKNRSQSVSERSQSKKLKSVLNLHCVQMNLHTFLFHTNVKPHEQAITEKNCYIFIQQITDSTLIYLWLQWIQKFSRKPTGNMCCSVNEKCMNIV